MKLFKSAFSKVHFVFMLFAAANVLLGFTLTLDMDSTAWTAVSLFHMAFGILLVLSVIFLPLFLKDGKKIYRALAARALPNKRDFEQKKYLALAAKIAVLLMALGFVVLFVSAAAIKTGIAPALIRFHTRFLYFMIALAVIHPILMKASMAKAKKPAAVIK
jgi:hypothetical protein